MTAADAAGAAARPRPVTGLAEPRVSEQVVPGVTEQVRDRGQRRHLGLLQAELDDVGREHERAAVLLGAASARWFSFGQQLYGSPDWQARRDHYQQQARRCLGEAAFEAAFRRGTLMTRPDMIRYALGRSEPAGLPGSLAGLTSREREVAAMVADGLTNRQIAERLVVSHRTVEGHVGRILTKLGLRRRTELAAWMWRQARGSGTLPWRMAGV